MATLLLGAAGSLIGGALFGPVGALAGRAIGAVGGALVDQTLLGGDRAGRREGPRLSDLEVMTSTAGAPVPRLYGRARLGGQVIWATRLKEMRSEHTESAGGKGGSLAPSTTTVTYSYYANFAVALCAGPISRIGRIWADGKLLDTRWLTIRSHLGTPDQAPDPLIAAKQGSAGTPAYRGIAYLVFENLDLTDFGNRLPQLTVEVERSVGALEAQVRAVTMIPGATEFGYDTRDVRRTLGFGRYRAESRHVATGTSDFEVALEQLVAACPNITRVSLVVAWFGDDLRAGTCQVRPRCEESGKTTTPVLWIVSGQTGFTAPAVSRHEGRAAYGGTPSDDSVARAIRRLKEAGIKVTLNPFVMMDIPAGNTRPDPWTGAAGQPPYPWRGRIVCDPAPGRPGSVEGTAACAAQVSALFGAAAPGDFHRIGDGVLYMGPQEWTLRRMTLHYAHLAVAAGGVEAILIGSEMEALTRLRDGVGGFPAAAALAALAADVKAVVGAGTLVSYGANWAEYGAQVYPGPGGEDVRFPLDVLWSSPAVDFVGIDYYPPFTDWRDGSGHLDADLAARIHDRAYLKASLRSGEAFDWFYADDAARAAQARTPITDGAYGEAWIYRQKDLWSWWSRPHHERFAGVRAAAPTAFVPGAKPIRLMEAGCGAVDKGSNRPSAFPDPKSSENALPPFSSGRRDDMIQRRCLEAIHAAFEPAAGASAADNPPASLYSGRMVEPGCVFLWTWDARPYPYFPLAEDLWADGANWETGHWLTGRLGSAPIDGLVATLCRDHGVDDVATEQLLGVVDGYVVQEPMSARAALEPLARVFAFEATEAGGRMAFRPRGDGRPTPVGVDDLVREGDAPLVSITRRQESELPADVAVTFIDPLQDYRRATVSSRRLVGASRHSAQASLALVAPAHVMARAADIWLQDLWAGRETVSFALAPSACALVPGDLLRLDVDGRERLIEIIRVDEAEARRITARSIESEVFDTPLDAGSGGRIALAVVSGAPEVVVLDLPAMAAGDPIPLQYLAASASPWPGTLAVWRSTGGETYEAISALPAPATFGRLLSDLAPGPLWRFDRASTLTVALDSGALTSQSEAKVLDGANALVLFAGDRPPEIIQFATAELVDAATFRLAGLLRGCAGTEAAGDRIWPEGTRILRLDGNVLAVARGVSAMGRSYVYRVGLGSEGHGGADVTQVSSTVGRRALLPWSPVHLRARRTGAGIALSFIRRTRIDGDNWDLDEVPLNEPSELYDVEILNGASVARVLPATTTSLVYPAAQELDDFGAPQAAITVRVTQRSTLAGPGTAREAKLRL